MQRGGTVRWSNGHVASRRGASWICKHCAVGRASLQPKKWKVACRQWALYDAAVKKIDGEAPVSQNEVEQEVSGPRPHAPARLCYDENIEIIFEEADFLDEEEVREADAMRRETEEFQLEEAATASAAHSAAPALGVIATTAAAVNAVQQPRRRITRKGPAQPAPMPAPRVEVIEPPPAAVEAGIRRVERLDVVDEYIRYGGGRIHQSHKLRFTAQYLWCTACAGTATGKQAKRLAAPCRGNDCAPGSAAARSLRCTLDKLMRGHAPHAGLPMPDSGRRGVVVMSPAGEYAIMMADSNEGFA